ncbi:BREX system P-loop protein BrxC [Pelobacter propionicus]|uniref:ATPase-like protein n=1 Tax=Pelobacter propionicus (strain DSM 2379 / NBRC 103807 / OttBd1) TaxID=338966 RepID=A1ARC6_PELPD|nr:BREX system P-loop protein BrxC [Pelobacter propionicus]ABK99896.1 ATPase-like protein [Pelobacter propionicus DSM 2379]
MHIKNIFAKNLFRPINGVVKADQQDESVVWQELDEYVVTRELDKHFVKFFDAYLSAMDNPNDPAVAARMAVWVSGFFGSGKSHFLKILSYLLGNYQAHNSETNQNRKAVEFFEEKIADAMLQGDIKRAVASDTDVILFNIDSKADNKDGKDAILSVFLRVFNEKLGYSGDDPHIASMERYLQSKGALEKFHQAFKEASGTDWIKERDAYSFSRDEIIKALSIALEMGIESASIWFDEAEERFKINIEGFSKLVKEYLDSKGPKHRIVFLADEVGQFIGSETHLMLNLQTITEDLGRICNGRAWVIVTSQEDIDAILGEVRGSKANDFSKIQGRFYTRLSLSSTNTDEVIQARLLEKTGDARRALEELWHQKGDILKNQISFTHSATLKNYSDAKTFEENYPFAPYHFQLVQKIFESIRKAGATGMHLSRGERSMLDAFQSAAKSVSEQEIGTLVPLYEFYPAIESFLDTIVKKTIEQADDNTGLEPFDTKLLRVLFLIRYVDILKPTVDNLVTLCIDKVDADRLTIKRQIEESLQRLEKETLITSNGDLYFFLTNEERDVSREIKNVDIASSEQTKQLAELIFEEVYKGDNKFRYQVNKRDYGYNRICDGQFFGSNAGHDLTIEVITPLNDDYQAFNPAKCIMQSASTNGGSVVIKLEDSKELGRELRTLLQTDKYIRLKNDAAAPDNLKRILKDRAEQNRERKGRLIALLDTMLLESDYYAYGQTLQIKASTARNAVTEGINYLVENIFSKLGYLKIIKEEPLKEITAILKSNDIGQYSLQVEGGDANELAVKEVKQFIYLSTTNNQKVLLHELVERFARRPYGWGEWEIILLVARLFMAGDLNLMSDGAALTPKEAVDPLTKQVKWKQVTVLKRKAVGEEELKKARAIGKDIFHVIGPDSEDQLNQFLRENITAWQDSLNSFKPLAQSGRYPGSSEITNGLKLIQKLLNIHDSFEFFDAFNKAKDDLLDLSDDMQELNGFYTTQKPTWDKLQSSMDGVFKANRQELVKDADAKKSLLRMDEILKAPRPYGMIKDVDGLINAVSAVNAKCVDKERVILLSKLEEKISLVAENLEAYKATADVRNHSLKPLQDIKKQVQEEQSIPNMHYQLNKADDAVDSAMEEMEKAVEQPPKPGGGGPISPPAKPVKNVTAASCSSKSFLETEADVNEYLEALKKELMAAVQNSMRVRIK